MLCRSILCVILLSMILIYETPGFESECPWGRVIFPIFNNHRFNSLGSPSGFQHWISARSASAVPGTKPLVVGSLGGLGHFRGRTRVAAIVVVGGLGTQDSNYLLNEQETFQHFHNWYGWLLAPVVVGSKIANPERDLLHSKQINNYTNS